MCGGLCWGLVPIGACFDLGQDLRNVRIMYESVNLAGRLLFNRSMAHCSNCSRVISAVGGVSYRFRRYG